MNEKVIAFDQQFLQIFNESQRCCFISRAKELQIEQRERLKAFAFQASELKKETITTNDEDSANAMLSFELMVEAATEEVEMWIAMRDEWWDMAWDHLMNAQSSAQVAIRVHLVGEHVRNYVQALHLIEQLVFPPQTFLSSGLIIERTECSICGQTYGECDHLAGKAYMGQICLQVVQGIKEITEVSIVKHPADKRCRVLNPTDNGVKRDIMTWRMMPADPMEKNAGDQYKIAGYAVRTDLNEGVS